MKDGFYTLAGTKCPRRIIISDFSFDLVGHLAKLKLKEPFSSLKESEGFGLVPEVKA